MFADVLVELKAKAVDQTFTYKIGENLKDSVKVGIRVEVPFGRQRLEGFVLKIKNHMEGSYTPKEILSCTDSIPILNEELLELGSYISKKTLSTKIQSYQTMLPAALKAKKDFVVPKKYATYIHLLVDIDLAFQNCKNEKQKEIISLFDIEKKVLKSTCTMISTSALQTLCKHNIVQETKEEIYRLERGDITFSTHVTLTEEQKKVTTCILAEKGFKPYLLHGITGSGKTEVYMHLIQAVLQEKKTALVLVPEISLTPQFVDTFKKRFGDQIAILHSHLSSGEKYDEWRKIEREEVSIVIGARSAVFAPLTKIGVIILDEEHSSSYKQENTPKYHAIEIALYRGKYHNCPVVLGSATPSIESYTRAKMGVYTLLEMKKRIGKGLPKVHLIDMKEEIKRGNSLFSRQLKEKIEDRLTKKEQVILLLNRRGYSTIITCHDCGYTDKCPHCDIPLTFHKASTTMRCHYCGYGKAKVIQCPSCQSTRIDAFGLGTQKLEEEVQKIFERARILRMDADTTTHKNAYEKIVHDFRQKKYDILVGTQMIAKGLDFEDVTLVGVLSADASLTIPDFRSAERTYALLNQVAGRAGRSQKEGEVIFQGFNMNHYSILKASVHDYTGFYEEEMKLRKLLGYPPYYNISSIEISSKIESLAITESEKIRSFLDKNNKELVVLGPAPASMPKKNDRYYYKIILKYKKREEARAKLTYILDVYKKNTKVSVQIDLNPLSL